MRACGALIALCQGPFSTFTIDGPPLDWTSVRFSPNGALLALAAADGRTQLLDAFAGTQASKSGHGHTPLVGTMLRSIGHVRVLSATAPYVFEAFE